MARIEDVLVDHLKRQYRGEDVSDETLIDDHPELMPELGDQLRGLRDLPQPSAEKNGVAADKTPLTSLTSTPGRILRIRCPRCRESVSMSAQTPFASITCEACGSRFSLTKNCLSVQDDMGARQFAHFELVQRVGRGAFGTVWKARDKHLDRVVAVKIPCSGRLDIHETEKFLREARAAAQLNHPNIVSVHEVGREGDTVYIVSDLVQGVPLADWMIGHSASFREAAEVCAKIADALEHAHQAGVIHRDLKPQNILLDDACEPHVTDFGLARRETGEVTITQDGHILGTPAYMSPEQARGEAHTADRRSDVYSVGVILYELLTGEVPFRGTPQMLLHHVLHDDPRSPRSLNHRIPRDLETICLKAMAKEPRHRYPTARHLADELNRFLDGQPVRARPTSSLTKGWRWCRRNPAVASLGAGVASLLLLLAIAGPIVAIGQARARREAEEARQEAEMNRTQVQALADRDRRRLYVQDMNAALQAWKDADIPRVVDLLERHVPQVDREEDLRSFIWYHLWRKCHKALTGPQLKFSETVSSLAFSPNGRWMAVGSGQTVHIYESAARHRSPPVRRLPAEGAVMSLAFSPDSSWLAIGDADALTLWDHKTKRLLWKNKDLPEVESMAFTSDGKQLVASSGPVHRLDVTTGRRLSRDLNVPRRSGERWARSVAISPGGKLLATADYGGGSTIFDLESRGQLDSIQAHTGHGNSVAVSPHGSMIATAGNDATLQLWNATTRKSIATLNGHTSAVEHVAFSPDGQRLATASRDCTVRLWDVQSEQLVRTFRGHTRSVRRVAFSPDGTYLVSGSEDKTLRFWDLTAHPEPTTLRGHPYLVDDAVLFPDHRTLASVSSYRELRFWDLVTAKTISVYDCDFCEQMALSPDGKTLILKGLGKAEIWDVGKKPIEKHKQLKKTVTDCVFSPDGSLLATGGDNEVTLWDTSTWEVLQTIDGYGAWHTSVLAFNPDSDRLAVPIGATVAVWDVADPRRPVEQFKFDATTSGSRRGTPTLELPPTMGPVSANTVLSCIAFSHDGTKLATATFDGEVKLWDAETGEQLGESACIGSRVAFSRDDKTLVICGATTDLKLWNVSTQEQIARLEGHEGPVWLAFFSPDSHMLISTSMDTTIKIWKAASKVEVAATRPLSELLSDD